MICPECRDVFTPTRSTFLNCQRCTMQAPHAPPERTVVLDRELFRFESYQRWVDKGKSWFVNCDVRSSRTLYLDAKGRVVLTGAEFMRAKDDDAYPIVAYDIGAVNR